MFVLVVLVLLGLVIGAHGCEPQYVGQPLEAASTATAGAPAAAQRSMDRVRGSGLPPRVRPLPDGCPFVLQRLVSFGLERPTRRLTCPPVLAPSS